MRSGRRLSPFSLRARCGSACGITYNHFLSAGDEPLLYCGKRKMFPVVSAAVAGWNAVERRAGLRFGHFEGTKRSMKKAGGAPAAQLCPRDVGCRVSGSDMADREPRVFSDGEVIDIVASARYIDTPHVPHGGMLASCSRKRPHFVGRRPCLHELETVGDHRERKSLRQSIESESLFHYTSLARPRAQNGAQASRAEA